MKQEALLKFDRGWRNLGSSILLLAIEDYKSARQGSEERESAERILFPQTNGEHRHLDWVCQIIGVNRKVVEQRLAKARGGWDARRPMYRNGWKTA